MADSSFPSRRSSTASRRTLQRRSSRLSQNDNLIDIFSDDNDVDFMPVSDGFRPSTGPGTISGSSTGSTSPPRPSSPQLPPRAASPPRATEYLKKRLAGQERGASSIHRSSLPGSQRDSMINRASYISRDAQSTPRPLSTVSAISIPSSESPYVGSAGPSHDYAAYPQVSGLTRNASTSTVRTQNRPYSGPSRPTHPYAMYPQIPGPQEAGPFADPADIANVGFPGLGQSYARLRGNDTEGADDLIGPDGHTEQLPPYTQYPNDLPPKIRGELPEAGPSHLTAAAASIDTLAGETLTDPDSATSLLDNDDGTRINVAARRAAGDEGLNRTQRLKQAGKRDWMRVPVWVWFVIVAILCMIAVGLGVALGKTLAHGDAQADSNSTSTATTTSASLPPWNEGSSPLSGQTTVWATVTTTLIDASPYATPPVVAPLPDGSWLLEFSEAKVANNNCALNDNHTVAWQCSKQSYLALDISTGPQGNRHAQFIPKYPHNNPPLLYGPQAPIMRGPANVSLMQDLTEQNSGPAWFFQQLFDKLVILRDSQVNSTTGFIVANQVVNHQLGPPTGPPPNSRRRAESENGNGEDDAYDVVESYLEEREALPLDISSNDLEARGNGDSPLPVLTGDKLWYCFWNKTIIEGFMYTNLTPPADPEQSEINSVAAGSLYSDQPATAAQPSARSSSAPTSTSAGKSAASPYPSQSPFPYILKLEERRGPGMPSAACQKMQALPDGRIVPAKDDDGVVTYFNVTEKQLIFQKALNIPGLLHTKRSTFQAPVYKDIDGACKCIWQVPN